MKLIYIDTETTGLNCKENALIEIAVVVAEYDVKRKAHIIYGQCDVFMNALTPTTKISSEALVVNGYTEEFIRSLPSNEDAFETLTNFFNDQIEVDDDVLLVGQNPYFDLSFFNTEVARVNSWVNVRSVIAKLFAYKYKILDTQALIRFNNLLGGGNGSGKLQDEVDRLDLSHHIGNLMLNTDILCGVITNIKDITAIEKRPHTALYDCFCCMAILDYYSVGGSLDGSGDDLK